VGIFFSGVPEGPRLGGRWRSKPGPSGTPLKKEFTVLRIFLAAAVVSSGLLPVAADEKDVKQ
jgi:hypothetical protein